MDLPKNLAPWAASLSELPPRLALALGPLLHRLHAALGPLRARHLPGEGEPDGFDGLARRGLYERLLVSEWLLADEAPEEFVRRAAMGEHLFLELARPTPTRGRLAMALFDAGPSQIGGPRIVHIALLILLARRAAEARASFVWGVAQRPGEIEDGEIGVAALRHLLGSRTARPATRDDFEAWRQTLGQWSDLDECWWIGGPPLESLLPPRTAKVIVDDVLEPAVRGVAVRIEDGRRPAIPFRLDLPRSDDCIRLLRDPLAESAVAPRLAGAEHRPVSNMVFSPHRRRLFARNAQGNLLAFPIPNSARGNPGRPKQYQPSWHPVYAARLDQRTLLLAYQQRGWIGVEAVGGGRGGAARHPLCGRFIDDAGKFEPTDGGAARLRVLVPQGCQSGGPICLLLLEGSVLYRLLPGTRAAFHQRPQGGSIERLAEGVLALQPLDDTSLAIVRTSARGAGRYQLWRIAASCEPVEDLGEEVLRAEFLLRGEHGRHRPTLAIEYAPGRWRIRSTPAHFEMVVPAGSEVVGLAPTDGPGGLLLVLSEARGTRLSVVGLSEARSLAELAAPPEAIAVCPWGRHIAWRTAHELVIVLIESGAIVYRLVWGPS